MKVYRLILIGGILLLVAGLSMMGFAQDEPNPVGEPPTFLLPYYEAWVSSPHADAGAEAFVHWNEDGAIEEACATCHSTPGYQDFLGADGSEAGVVNQPAALGSVVNCDACHNPVAAHLTEVTFPSGITVTDIGDSTRCMVCHQGRASTVQVNAKIADLALDENTPSEELGFINIHYYAAAASLYGSEVQGGYQYAGKSYQPRYSHIEGYQTCNDCHNPHTLEIKVNECATCHEDVETVEDLEFIRMQGSMIDYDGDEDTFEGIKGEIETLQEMLMEAMQIYAAEVAGTPIAYSQTAYPYFFVDTNENNEADEDEAVFPNAYKAFTPALLKAAYNYQVSQKDPGGYAHNPKYHIELLFDSIEALNAEMAEGVDLSFANRNDPGHFDATAEAFRHWDEDGIVPGACVKCHTADGLGMAIANNGATIALEPSNSLACSTCHDAIPEFTVYELADVTFPSGAKVSFGEGDTNNMCLNCHQGRESTVSVNNAIKGAGVGDDEISEALSFRNVHYFAAGASLFGTETKGGYEFTDKEYVGRFNHAEDMNTCTSCHDVHALTVNIDECAECHEDVETLEDVQFIRAQAEGVDPIDYNGNGDVEEGISAEVKALEEVLLAQIQTYATETIKTSILYNANRFPYWFVDANGNGVQDEEDTERYVTWTPNLLRAAYNYQFVHKDPGGYIHNADYQLQLLYDSIEAMGGAEAVASFTRP